MKQYFNFKKAFKHRRGFTLLEIMIAIGITGVLSTSIATAMYQLQSVSNAHYTYIVAVNQVENAIHYLNRDVQSSQIVNPTGTHGFPLILKWNTWDTGDINTVTYNFASDSPLPTWKLTRQFQLNGGAATTTEIARYIVSYTSCTTSVGQASAARSTVLRAADTSAFPPIGALVLPGELLPVTYSGKTAQSFTGIPATGSGSLTKGHSAGEIITTYSSYTSYDSANHKLIVQLTSQVTQGDKQTEETRQMVIVPRPGS
jgi:prepilin-type N-terminal cleavage/methylation domain-containing protein